MACELCNGDACKSEKDIRVSFCPKCKSRNVKYVFEVKNLFGVLPKMRCEKCGTEMPSFPVLVTNKKLLAKSSKIKNRNKVGRKGR
ncbi:MAG: hypothetical protein KKF50_00400 [Nanoarchaeota archaeon]|nr:hypothetical protein [Nanoarchaeota archaeon]